ncbi:MAG: HAD-IIA family hydrolase [Clostridiales bacterium]|nr:HAD-IIA family hydrolase [Clostridiales bacterium]
MLKSKKLFLFDIDGTVCKGNQLFRGVREFLVDIRECGGQFVFITNNSTTSIRDYIKRFEGMGIVTDDTNFVTASYATVRYLKKNHSGELIYVMGTTSFIRELRRNHIRVTTDCTDSEIACVLISYDSQMTYEKIRDTCELLSTREVDYVATNPDLVCPIEFGFVPDCGAICEMLEHAIKRKPLYIGKPETAMIEDALKMNPFTKEETLVVGDRLYTDILSGYRAGVETALVLTGEATKEDAERSDYKPDYIFDSIESLYHLWKM